ncbi:acyl carrier protein, partial [Streptomyces sp. NPDC057621]|uniref:acyl carrier protein n=1 Tax=Streptomyces sp. NPDC057621 TaxID=3346186 RepID=UPI00368FC011
MSEIGEPGGRDGGEFAALTAAGSASEQLHLLLELVRAQTLAVLRRADPQASERIDAERPFRDIGIDSLGLVELHSRLTAATGLPLPVTIGFDYPSPVELAEYPVTNTHLRA